MDNQSDSGNLASTTADEIKPELSGRAQKASKASGKSMSTANAGKSGGQSALSTSQTRADDPSLPPSSEKAKTTDVKPAHGDQLTEGKKAQSQMTKAERREIQERQRAAKAGGKPGAAPAAAVPVPPRPRTGSITAAKSSPRSQNSISETVPHSGSSQSLVKMALAQPKPVMDVKQHERQRSFNSETISNIGDAGTTMGKLGIFAHLPVPRRGNASHLTETLSFSSSSIHPAIVKLGIQYSAGVISGSNARCVALICAMKQVIRDYKTPPNKFLSRDLETTIKPYINFLAHCRPLAVSMGNAIRHLKYLITHTPVDSPDAEAKEKLIEQLDHYVEEKIILAGKAIAENYAAEKITDGDVILTYSCSSLVTKVLIEAYNRGKQFSVVVVDGRPKNEGKELLRRLVRQGLRCSYAHINSISYIMPEITKIFMGAECLLANGYVTSRVGTSQIALVAKAFNVPVLICCETYKFCERVQTDSIVHNELGNPEDLRVPGIWSPEEDTTKQNTGILNFLFDVTPPDMITMVITELGMVPCTSVPVILRVKHVPIK